VAGYSAERPGSGGDEAEGGAEHGGRRKKCVLEIKYNSNHRVHRGHRET